MKHCTASILLFVLMASCSPKPALLPTASPVPTMTSSPIPATVTLMPSPLPPTVTLTPFIPKATITIAGQGPLTGNLAVGGMDIMRGAELAVKQLSDPLMNLGYKIELVPYDDQNDMGVAVSTAKEIVADSDVLCGVGPYTSRVVNQVKEIYHQAGLGFVSPSTTGAYATASGYLEVNRVMGRHDGQGVAGAQFASEQGYSRVFTISHNGNYEMFSAYHFRNESSQLGLQVVGNLTTDAMMEFGTIIESIIASNADMVYFSSLNVEQAGTFFREARAAGYLGAFMSNANIAVPALIEFAGPLLIDGGGMYYTSTAMPASYYPAAAEFIEDFETFYGMAPQMFAAQAYDAAGICMKAIEQATKDKGGEIPTRAEVANAIRALQEYQGITGVYTFDENGDPNPAQYFIFQVVSVNPSDWNQNVLVTTFKIAPPK